MCNFALFKQPKLPSLFSLWLLNNCQETFFLVDWWVSWSSRESPTRKNATLESPSEQTLRVFKMTVPHLPLNHPIIIKASVWHTVTWRCNSHTCVLPLPQLFCSAGQHCEFQATATVVSTLKISWPPTSDSKKLSVTSDFVYRNS